MILYLNEDRAYLHWVAHHRGGFVLDCGRPPRAGHATLHRATCPTIKHAETRKTHWTTGRRMKACALDAEELKAWMAEQTEAEPALCPECLGQEPSVAEHPVHLTRADREMLSFILEVAALHLDESDSYYTLSVGSAAKCLGKTPGQLAASLHRLVAEGLVALLGKSKPGEAIPASCTLLPTAAALKMLPIYQSASDEEVAAELAKLVEQLEG